ncbi:hypothetical protein EII38_00435 [Streptococcus minor]|uniref:DUF4097 domain-containing protein n=1 Tax=Streptococcus minor TaxID=229549 RepID=A0A3P1VEW8_9STRE|nr:DUF4097 family beta strand repeat-containing protein [Streptococcus minor]MDO5078856.1 DUF4097 family beta strand repeat-containing protein [Streptococcus minor]RRD32237.1 hypothetical protein EII38_00435 [Streptococcus minor]
MKTIQRIAGVFLLLGVIIGGIVLVRTGGDFSRLNNETVEQKEKSFQASQMKELNFDMSSTDVEVVGSADTDKVVIKYPESKKQSYSITEENGKVTITEKHDRILNFFRFDIDFFNLKKWTIQIVLPVDSLETLTLNGASGDVDISKLVIKKNLALSLRSGDVYLQDTTVAGETSVRLSSGEIELTNIVSKDLYLKATSGDLDVDRVIVANQSTMEVTSGDIVLSQFKAGQKTDLSTTSGDISGSLVGQMIEYTIQSKVTSGDNSLPQHLEGGSKQLRVEATSGDITIRFDQ